jgi:hypothetical protein
MNYQLWAPLKKQNQCVKESGDAKLGLSLLAIVFSVIVLFSLKNHSFPQIKF